MRASWGWQPAARWVSAIGALIVYDAYCAFGRNSKTTPTLSQLLREYVGHEHKVGRAVFLTGWAGLTAWFLPHIVGKAAHAVEDVLDLNA